ncbi:DEAD/DEAH box helicase [Metapseudomonas otitidis]
MAELTLRRLKNTEFSSLYRKVIRGVKIEEIDRVKLLAIAIVLINQTCPNLKRLGYRITLFYGNSTGDFSALMDVALNSGLIPVYQAAREEVVKLSEEKGNSLLFNLAEGYLQNFKIDSLVVTEQQLRLRDFFRENYELSLAVVAPTSYGKSELIMSAVRDNPDSSFCILVPSKSLLAQTKKRLINSDGSLQGKIITHPEMYRGVSKGCVFILTQERLSRLLSENKEVFFDFLIVDEAHNLLGGDLRSQLLAVVISIVKSRNRQSSIKYLTPFLNDQSCLTLRYVQDELKGFKVGEYVKSERFYTADYRSGGNEVSFYDQFMDEWIPVGGSRFDSAFDFLKNRSLGKNIVYLNKPKSLEELAFELAGQLPDVDCPLIKRACEELRIGVHSQYFLIDCLKKGVVYHHGSMPETVRLYVENLFSKSQKIKYLVCNSTLLEGVNFPIERIFLFDVRKGRGYLSSAQFKNLVGRVNRFSEVFVGSGKNVLEKLQPHVYLVGSDQYMSHTVNITRFLDGVANVTRANDDDVQNLLLSGVELHDGNMLEFKGAVERLENLERGIVDGYSYRYSETKVGALLFANNVSEIDIFANESEIQELIDFLVDLEWRVEGARQLFEVLSLLFFRYFEEGRVKAKILRLKKYSARNFYIRMLTWKLERKTFNQIVRLLVRYWETAVEKNSSYLVYADAWGDMGYGEHKAKRWVDIRGKTSKEKINLAIVRFKEEDDFFEYVVFKFIEVVNSVGLMREDFYNRIKYGTSNETKIALIRSGLSKVVVDVIFEKYIEYISLGPAGELSIRKGLAKAMESNGESDLMIFELNMNIKD